MEPQDATARILTTRNVVLARNGKSFARLPDLDVGSGQSVAVVGPSGGGKTTALMAIAGMRAPQSGEIGIEKSDPWKLGRTAGGTAGIMVL